MSELLDIYKIRMQLESGLSAALTAAEFAVVTRANEPENYQQLRPRLELKARLGPSTGHRHICPDGLVRLDAWRVTVAVQAITAPQGDGLNALHEEYLGKLRSVLMTLAQYTFADSVNFPNLFLAVPFKDSGTVDTLKTGEGVEYSVLLFDSIVQIRESAWPQPS